MYFINRFKCSCFIQVLEYYTVSLVVFLNFHDYIVYYLLAIKSCMQINGMFIYINYIIRVYIILNSMITK